MTKYDYLKHLKEDVKNAILDNYTKVVIKGNLENLESRDDFAYKLYDDLFDDDIVTGNASGSYTFNTYQAEENLCHNWDLLEDALNEFGVDYKEAIQKGAEYCDVTIRCYLLGEAIDVVLDELSNIY